MSTVVLMRILESTPARYDAGMRLLGGPGLGRAQQRAAELAVWRPGAKVLELGCGTGELTRRLLALGAEVEAIEQDPAMLDRARAKLEGAGARLGLRHAVAAEIDRLPQASFDAVAASLVLSEMSRSERAYVLRHATRLLKTGGRMVVLDEVTPKGVGWRLLQAAVRLPLALLAWIVAGRVSRPLEDLHGELKAAGLEPVEHWRSPTGTLALVVATRPERRPA